MSSALTANQVHALFDLKNRNCKKWLRSSNCDNNDIDCDKVGNDGDRNAKGGGNPDLARAQVAVLAAVE